MIATTVFVWHLIVDFLIMLGRPVFTGDIILPDQRTVIILVCTRVCPTVKVKGKPV